MSAVLSEVEMLQKQTADDEERGRCPREDPTQARQSPTHRKTGEGEAVMTQLREDEDKHGNDTRNWGSSNKRDVIVVVDGP